MFSFFVSLNTKKNKKSYKKEYETTKKKRFDTEPGALHMPLPEALEAWEGESTWAMLDLNQRPHPYQGCALTN